MATPPRKRRVVIGALILLALGGAAVAAFFAWPQATPESPAYATPIPVAAGMPICSEAAALINAGHPDDAITLIKDARSEAKSATPASPTPTSSVSASPTSSSPPASNSSASSSSTQASTTLCAGEYSEALIAEGQLKRGATPNPSAFAELGFRWNAFVTSTAEPIASFAFTILCIFLVWLVLARLAVLLPSQPLGLRSDVSVSSRARRAVGVACFFVMAASAFLLAYGLTIEARDQWQAGTPTALGVWTVIGALCAGLLAAGCFSTLLAARLRLTIDVAGSSDPSLAPRLAALITEIGGALPRGVETPVGSDVTALRDDVVAVKSPVAWVGAVQSIAGWLLLTAPWRVVIGSSTTPAALSVVIFRNSHQAAGFTITTTALVPASPTVPVADAEKLLAGRLAEFAAAAVVTTLAKHYRGFDGLSGTTDWKSLGLQFIATTTQMSSDLKRQLLSWSVVADPANILALIALQRLRAANIADLEDRQRYVDWLRALLSSLDGNPKQGTREVKSRLLLTLVVERLNIRGVSGAAADSHLDNESEELLEMLSRTKQESPLYKQMRPVATIARACARVRHMHVDMTDYEAVVTLARVATPYTAFNAACYFTLALWSGALCGENEAKAIVQLKQSFATAMLNPAYKDRALTDEILKTQSDKDWFAHIAGS